MQATTRPLNELLERGDSSTLELHVFGANNLGNRTLITRIPFYDFFRISRIANERSVDGGPITQRKLDTAHATALGRYILKSVLSDLKTEDMTMSTEQLDLLENLIKIVGEQPYAALQPIVTTIRTAGPNGEGLQGEPLKSESNEPIGLKVWLTQKDVLHVIDGQHRRQAMQMVIDFLETIKLEHKYPTKKNKLFPHGRDDRMVPTGELNLWLECEEILRSQFSVSVEIHLGLNIEQERQLFHDLNNLGKKVEKSLALEFDISNPVNQFIKSQLLETGILRLTEGDNTDWHDDDGSFTRKEIVGVNAHLILNKTNINNATPNIVDSRIETAIRFWHIVDQIEGFGEEHSKQVTIASQAVVLKALGKLTYDFAFGKNSNISNLEKLFEGIPTIDFSHHNPMWRYYQLSDDERTQFGLTELANYLPDSETGNRDIGNYDGTWMRFGSKHNDIFPIIGDMIRWKLDLPNRHKR